MGEIKLRFGTGAKTNLADMAIRARQSSIFTHVDSVTRDNTAFGALPGGGVQNRPLSPETWWVTSTIVLPCSEKVADDYYKFIYSQVGKEYNWPGIFEFAEVDPFPHIPNNSHRGWRREDIWYCSELVHAGLVKSSFYPYTVFCKRDFIDPGNLFFLLSGFTDVFSEIVINPALG